MPRAEFHSDRARAGNANVEFALCAIFVIFLLISIFDMARGLWIYHTLSEAVRDGTRWAIVHGDRYVDPTNPDPLTNRLPGATLGDAIQVIERAAVGIVPSQLNLTFTVAAVGSGGSNVLSEITCKPATAATCTAVTGTCVAAGNVASTSNWPPNGCAQSNLEVGITAQYPYNSMVVMFFPGMKGVQFGKYILGSSAHEAIVF